MNYCPYRARHMPTNDAPHNYHTKIMFFANLLKSLNARIIGRLVLHPIKSNVFRAFECAWEKKSKETSSKKKNIKGKVIYPKIKN